MKRTPTLGFSLRGRALAAWCLSLWIPSALSTAGDWPQILGPQRNGIATGEPAVTAWPTAGPQRLWSVEIGSGFAGPAVAENRAIIFHRVDDSERVQCFDATTGKPVWQTDFPASYRGSVNPDSGPRCVPLIHRQRVYLFGAAGDLYCVELAGGRKVWSRDTHADFKAMEGYFGAGSTPLVADDKLLVNVGGRSGGIVAFELATGKTAWQATTEQGSYSSPTLATLNGVQHAIFVTRMQCVAVEPRTGRIAFTLRFGMTGPTVNAATPLVFDDRLFLSASYTIGAKLLKLGTPPTEIWSNDDSMSSQYTTCVYREGFLYGIHGREDYRTGELRCVEARTGKVKWATPSPVTGSVLGVADQLLILTADGQLQLAAARPDKFVELAHASVSPNVTRSLPAYARGRFYFRDNAEDSGSLRCLKLGKE